MVTEGDGSQDSDAGEVEFRRSSDEFLERLDRLRQIELQKRGMDSSDPERPRLAIRVEALTLELLGQSTYQALLAEALGGPPEEPRRSQVVIAEWRSAARQLEEVSQVTRDQAHVVSRLRDEYRRGVETRLDRG